MKLQEKFQHPNGMEGTAEAVRTIIREERENVSKEQYRVRFYQNREGMLGEGSCYRYIPWRRDNVCSHRQNREAMVWYLPAGMTGMITRRTFHSR